MNVSIDSLSLFLFVPADRPERFGRAASAGADAVIVDLEDAVATGRKVAAREGLPEALAGLPRDLVPILVRINAIGTEWHDDDLDVLSNLKITGIVLPKAESAAGIDMVRRRIAGLSILAIVESARGLAMADDIAAAADRLAFGSIDFAADLGCAHNREALLLARSRIVLAARLAGKPSPVDGVTPAIRDVDEIEADTRYGASLGFCGKLLIHPAQVAPARAGMAPTEQDIEWAMKIVASAQDGAARAVDGAMVDAPVLARARQILGARNRF
jgi:citrate lyase subunit beta/citryl-CoA lyase